jgi:hypothetical protein
VRGGSPAAGVDGASDPVGADPVVLVRRPGHLHGLRSCLVRAGGGLMTTGDMLASLSRKAQEVGDLLNMIVDDDERELAQGHYEHALNNELWNGSMRRSGGHSIRVPAE